ncbi:ABC transporter permease subunit [Xinfangfangia sp. CPCC 101601]|uniref:ABC transporter permease subunit n=1 Tax=Pseudogemmobacter lacusdianii TaxID=3069608 RepID=A0ABU0W0S8_9RHOB|nr:ABC transporter permease subunit [Xinfangfangia sp. CPCC 101601]MDQ2067625.1 ABC transporter permease subunit [Xinfangfangia sp. CPCC 101601]
MTSTAPKDASYDALVAAFTGRPGGPYARVFERIAETTGFAVVFNAWAALLGPIWLAARALWGAFWIAFLIEMFGGVLVGVGLFGDLGGATIQRAERLTLQATERLAAAEAAIAEGNSLGQSMKRSADAIAASAAKANAEADIERAKAPQFILAGMALILGVHACCGAFANAVFARRFRAWRANPTLAHGLSLPRLAFAVLLPMVCLPLAVYRFAAATPPAWLQAFPADLELRNQISRSIDWAVAALAESFGTVFLGVTQAISALLNLLEICLVVTPWPIVMMTILAIAWQVSGRRVAIFSAAALAYLAVLGFWEKSMATVALLGTAAALCVALGIPIGIWCGRSPRAYAILRPVLDFMQTMPAFVYLIPVIAFFGIGKPPGIIATLIFGMPPVIRLTALGIAGVPASVREAATAFGASGRFLLFKVDLPLAMPSIMTGVNQTLLMCLSMVVIASLIGAKGLGEDVLSALQYAAVGQGILAGLAILMCAVVLDRIVQGKRSDGN